MKCITCQTENGTGQKFCGSCGNSLSLKCSYCAAVNSPSHSFCDQCGHNLLETFVCSLNQAGLIVEANHFFSSLIGQNHDMVVGKPFSLFVSVEDLARFYSFWNELPRNHHSSNLEIKLRHPQKNSIPVKVECDKLVGTPGNLEQVYLILTDVSQRKVDKDYIDFKDKLIKEIFSISKAVSCYEDKCGDVLVGEILGKISLFSGAENCFLYKINENDSCLDFVCRQELSNVRTGGKEKKTVSFFLINQILIQLRRKQSYVVDDVSKLLTAERNEIFAWQGVDSGVFICQLLILNNKPVGVIGLSCLSLKQFKVKDIQGVMEFSGLLLLKALNLEKFQESSLTQTSELISKANDENKLPLYEESDFDLVISVDDALEDVNVSGSGSGIVTNELVLSEEIVPTTQMQFAREQLQVDGEIEKIFAINTDNIPLVCAACGLQNFVPSGTFDDLGCCLKVMCPCQNSFSVMREQRRFYRKEADLEGVFKVANSEQFYFSEANWVPSVITDLSKFGIRFTARELSQVKLGDRVLVQFNLDNSAKTFIEKPAFIQSISGLSVGCKFEDNGDHDVTLGFYML